MSYVKPAVARHITDYFNNQRTITILSQKQWFQLPFLIFWLMSWTFGELAVINDIGLHKLSGEGLFFLIWAAVWTAGGALALLTVLWILLGRETIGVDGRTLNHRRQILGFSWTKRYDTARICNLRAASPLLPRFRQWPGWRSYAVVAFDYGDQTIRIGNSIATAEAQQIIRTLHAQCNAL